MSIDLINREILLEFDYKSQHFSGHATPVSASCQENVCYEHQLHLNGKSFGILYRRNNDWVLEEENDQGFVNKVGKIILLWYE